MATISIYSQLKQIKDCIQNNDLLPLYLLKGDESYYIDLICNEFENKIIDQSVKDFNQSVLYGKDTNAVQIISLCRQYPLMSDKKLVILKEAQLMEKNQWAKLLIYLNHPLQSTILVICNKSQNFDLSCKNAILKNKGMVFESNKLKEYQVPKWIIDFVHAKNFSIDESCANMLCEYLGNDLQKIANEIGKMILNIKNRKNITKEDISENVGISKDYNVFELQHALGTKNIIKANNIINYFAQNPKENPMQLVIPILFAFFTKLLIASQVSPKNASNVANALNFKSEYAVKDYMTALNHYSVQQLLNIISLFNEYDLKSKGINVSPMLSDRELMRELVFKILHI